MEQYTFDDLKFKAHPLGGKQALLFFPNGYGVSVVIGPLFYSNNVDTYEVAIVKGNRDKYDLTYSTPITNDVLGYLTKDDVTRIINEVQSL